MKSMIEINKQLDKAEEIINEGRKYFSMTYEQGVKDALNWVAGYTDDKPIED
jgi:hypothetical protein